MNLQVLIIEYLSNITRAVFVKTHQDSCFEKPFNKATKKMYINS
jgi:hypothetical protein